MQRIRNRVVMTLTALPLTVLAVVLPFSPTSASSADPEQASYVNWCHADEDRLAWCEWTEFMQDEENRAWFEWKTSQASSRSSVDQAIQAAFGDLGPGVVAQARRVAQCESQMNPRALNGNPRYQAAGLFQVVKQWASSYGRVTGVAYYDGRFDPYANARFARYLYDDGGRSWAHWVCQP